jgi:DoxX-like family
VLDIITHLGYPPYLLVILGVWKLLGGVVLFAPGVPRLKEWAYAGIFFELPGAAAPWIFHGDPPTELMSPIVLTVLAMTSWALRPPSRVLGALFASSAVA